MMMYNGQTGPAKDIWLIGIADYNIEKFTEYQNKSGSF